MTLNLTAVRAQFPALQRPIIFLDNPGGTQIARTSLEQIRRYLVEANANHGGVFATSQDSDQRVENARLAMADFLNGAFFYTGAAIRSRADAFLEADASFTLD